MRVLPLILSCAFALGVVAGCAGDPRPPPAKAPQSSALPSALAAPPVAAPPVAEPPVAEPPVAEPPVAAPVVATALATAPETALAADAPAVSEVAPDR